MSKPLLKKEIAAQAGISPRTMRRNPKQWLWLEKFKAGCSKRPTFNRERVNDEMRRRNMI